jgi:hypothetical protein
LCVWCGSIREDVDEFVTTVFLFAQTKWQTKNFVDGLLALREEFACFTNDDLEDLHPKLLEARESFPENVALERFEECWFVVMTPENPSLKFTVDDVIKEHTKTQKIDRMFDLARAARLKSEKVHLDIV